MRSIKRTKLVYIWAEERLILLHPLVAYKGSSGEPMTASRRDVSPRSAAVFVTITSRSLRRGDMRSIITIDAVSNRKIFGKDRDTRVLRFCCSKGQAQGGRKHHSLKGRKDIIKLHNPIVLSRPVKLDSLTYRHRTRYDVYIYMKIYIRKHIYIPYLSHSRANRMDVLLFDIPC